MQEFKLVIGIVNERLVPTVPLKCRMKDGEWQEISLLLDTGFDGEITLDAALLDEYGLATHPDHQLLTPDEVLGSDTNWNSRAPYAGEIEWERRERTVGIRMVEQHPLDGMLGTKMLEFHRLTMDASEGGVVTLERIPMSSSSPFTLKRPRNTECLFPFGGNFDEHLEWFDAYVPWTKLKVQDNHGRLNSIWVNVDTGDSGELSLPCRIVDRLGLTASGTCRVHTTEGLVDRNQGEAEIIWQGNKRRVRCIHLPNDKPPVIGMTLLKGNRITIDFDYPRPIVEIRPISQSRSVRGFISSLRNHFRS